MRTSWNHAHIVEQPIPTNDLRVRTAVGIGFDPRVKERDRRPGEHQNNPTA
jgi:hypothetical protein